MTIGSYSFYEKDEDGEAVLVEMTEISETPGFFLFSEDSE